MIKGTYLVKALTENHPRDEFRACTVQYWKIWKKRLATFCGTKQGNQPSRESEEVVQHPTGELPKEEKTKEMRE